MPKTISVPTCCTLCPRRCRADRAAGQELLAKAGAAPSGGTKAEARTADYYKKRPCPELCRMCADLCAEFIAAHPEGRCGVYKEDV